MAAAKQDATVENTLSYLDASSGLAIVEAQVQRHGDQYVDFLLLARINQQWRIVAKVLAERESPKASEKAIREVVNQKIQSDFTWLGMSLHGGSLVRKATHATDPR